MLLIPPSSSSSNTSSLPPMPPPQSPVGVPTIPPTTPNSNLNTLLTSLSLSSSNSTFTTATAGSAPDQAYGHFLCRGDVAPSDCQTCVENAAQEILPLCTPYKKATVWYTNCHLRYTDIRFYSIVDEDNRRMYNSNKNATDVDLYVKMETKLLDKIMYRAAYNSTMKFATGVVFNGSSGGVKVYALAQCARDLSAYGCNQCLQQIRGYYCGYEMNLGGAVLGHSCYFRYDPYLFSGGEPTVSLDISGPSAFAPPAETPSSLHNAGGDGKGENLRLLFGMFSTLKHCTFTDFDPRTSNSLDCN